MNVKRWGFIIPRWNFPGLFTWCKANMYWVPGNARNILEFLRRPEVAGNCKKISPLYLRKNLLATAGNFKVNEQTKYKSVPFFLFLAIERKPEIRNYWIFEPAIEIGNNTLGVQIDTSDINFLEWARNGAVYNVTCEVKKGPFLLAF